MKLVELLARHAYELRPEGEWMMLASGQRAREYVDCRRALGRPDVIDEAAKEIDVVRNHIDAVGGVAMGGIAIAAAVSVRSRRFIATVPWFYVRDTRKGHGTCHMIEGAVEFGQTVCLVDDVVTTGESVITAVLACQDFGLHVAQVIALVDREQSGLDRIRNVVGPEVPVSAICTLSQIREYANVGDGQ
jgi:orotate phosphoribosyltransferase